MGWGWEIDFLGFGPGLEFLGQESADFLEGCRVWDCEWGQEVGVEFGGGVGQGVGDLR